MKLLFDQNLSYRLVQELRKSFPGSEHVRLVKVRIWRYAKDREFVIVTFDSDFYERGLVHGFPPKIIWLRCGNTSTENVLDLLRRHQSDIGDFAGDLSSGCLELL